MDQNFNSQPSPQLPPSAPTIPPQPNPPAKPSTGTSKIIPVVIFLLLVASLTLSAAGLLLNSEKVDKSEQVSRAEAAEKRLNALEEADTFTEKQVDKDKYQAVFLSSSQVYFGKITAVTRDTMKLEDIYYLKTGSVDRTGNPTAGADVSLVKLGKELHAPEDVMNIERKNLTFWENLQNDGEVSKAIAAYKKSNQ